MKVFMVFSEGKARFHEWNSGIEIKNYYGECFDVNGKVKWFTDIQGGERTFTLLSVNGQPVNGAV